MNTWGNRWITGALLVAIGAWSAPMTTLAATTALRAPASQAAGAKTDTKHKKKKNEYKKPPQLAPKPKDKKKDDKSLALDTKKPKHKDQDKKPPQTLAAKEPKKDCKDKKKDGQLFA